VGPGIYSELLTIDSKNIMLSSAYGPDTTIISGRCRIEGPIDSTCIVKGFTIQDGESSLPLLTLVHNSPKIEGNIFKNAFNVATGGAIDCFSSNPIIRGNIIKNNQADFFGAGIDFDISSPYTTNTEISYNMIYNNHARINIGGGYGGGIHLAGNGIIKYNVIFDNEAYSTFSPGGSGGGIYFRQIFQNQPNKTIIMNNTIVNNTAKIGQSRGDGGGLLILSSSLLDSIIIVNNIFAFNPLGGNVRAYINDSVFCYWDYNLIFGDTISSFPQGQHDIFIDPSFYGMPIDDYRLNNDSPCIDAGDPSSPLDPDSTKADMGAYFFDQSVRIDDPGAPTGPYEFTLRQNYPNPFNAQTIISYCLDKEATVSLHIYAITGHLVKPLLNKEIQSAGEHNYIWDGRNAKGEMVSTGIFL
jgi:hypothetical protein